MNPTQIIAKVDEAWRQGFYIVWARIDGRVRSLGGESLASFPAPPDGLTIRHARTVLIRLWDRLPIEWDLPRVADPPSCGRRGEIFAWMAANLPIDSELTLDQFLNLPLAPDQDAGWWVRQIQRPMLEDLRRWEELVKELESKAFEADTYSLEVEGKNRRWSVWIGDDFRIRRDGLNQSIDISSVPRLREIARLLINRRGRVVEDLEIQCLDEDSELEQSTVRGYITKLKSFMKPLRVDIRRIRDTGYQIILEPVSENAPAQQ